MTLFIIALHAEAAPLIRSFSLQKVQNTPFPLYRNDKVTLLISGMGAYRSAIATTYALQHFNPDRIVNFGICGSARASDIPGTLYQIKKVIDTATRHVCHLTDSPLAPRTRLHTFAVPQHAAPAKVHLADMEASGFCQAAKYFLEKEKITVLKVVSDHMSEAIPEKAFVAEMVQRQMPLLHAIVGGE